MDNFVLDLQVNVSALPHYYNIFVKEQVYRCQTRRNDYNPAKSKSDQEIYLYNLYAEL